MGKGRIKWFAFDGVSWEGYSVDEDIYIGEIHFNIRGVYRAKTRFPDSLADSYPFSCFDNLLAAKRWITRTYREARP